MPTTAAINVKLIITERAKNILICNGTCSIYLFYLDLLVETNYQGLLGYNMFKSK